MDKTIFEGYENIDDSAMKFPNILTFQRYIQSTLKTPPTNGLSAGLRSVNLSYRQFCRFIVLHNCFCIILPGVPAVVMPGLLEAILQGH
jgi:hypothetical protein